MHEPSFSAQIKEPNVSGQFYTSNPGRLSAELDGYIRAAKVEPYEKKIGILISPHAGYKYSGPVAAYGFKAVSKNTANTVVILAPSHHFGFQGGGVWKDGGYKTPLGVAQVDEAFAQELLDQGKGFVDDRDVFAKEHSLEVQVPFVQRIFPKAKIVPVILGQNDPKMCESMAQGLNNVIKARDDVLVVVSTDMSHFHVQNKAKTIDAATLQAVKRGDPTAFWTQCQMRKMEMCGFVPVTTGMYLAKLRGLTSTDILNYATSGDVTGDMSRVVGYTSIVYYSPEEAGEKPAAVEQEPEQNQEPEVEGVGPLSLEQKKELIHIARTTIDELVRNGKKMEFKVTDPRLQEEEGAFVTIHKRGQLRGCIGNIIGRGPLHQTVRDMAISAASQDPRFSPVSADELKDIDVEISVLSKPRREKDPNKIEMGVHGVIVSRGFMNKGVFLPQVATDTGWSREQFLSTLCSQKAGLPADAWKKPGTQLDVFTANVFSEEDVGE